MSGQKHSRTAAMLREAGFRPLPRWWVREEHLDAVAEMAKQCSEEVSAIRRAANQETRNPRPEFLSKTEQLERELRETKAKLESSSEDGEAKAAIERMWHVVNDRMLNDEDKLDILFSELHKAKSA